MLIQSSLLSSVEAGLCYVSDDGEDVLCDRMPSGKTWQVCLKGNKHPLDWCRKAEPIEEDRRNTGDSYNSNCLSSFGRPSTAGIMTENSAPNMVYRRKKLCKGSVASDFNLGPTDVRTTGDSYNSNCLSSFGRPSTAGIMTEYSAPNMVYRRKKLCKGLDATDFNLGQTDVRTTGDSYNSNCLSSFGRPSTAGIMTKNNAPNMVYRRKKLCKGSVATDFNLGPTDVRTTGDSYNSNCLSSFARPSTACIMTENSAPTMVYRRKKLCKGSVATDSNLGPTDVQTTGDSYNSNCLSSPGRPSTAGIMTENSAPNMVYRRKKLRQGSVASDFNLGPTDVRTSANCPSVISSSAHLSSADDQSAGFQIKHGNENVKNPTVPSVLFDGVANDTTQKNLGIGSVNDSCSSSKSNMELVSDSIEIEMDETGECSSSSVIVMDATREELTEMDFCINILKSHGLLKGDSVTNNVASGEDAIARSNTCCSRSCKICGRLDSSLNMLLCDHCEDSYHPSCYNPRLKNLPIDEWFCHSCLKKRQKILKETMIRSPSIPSKMDKCRTASVKAGLNPILLMLRDNEPHTTSVRVGKGFQAEVFDWSGPIRSDVDDLHEPLQIIPSEFSRLQEENMTNPTRLSSIGNWLQCQEVVDRATGTICGKWRRAPLFEVQTDRWECFCAIHWDPSHADCAVPQEVETDQVLKQLKYIEMLRPRLASKQRKSDSTT